MTSIQLRGLADLAEEWGGGYADITTRANFQVREIAPRNMVKCLLKLQEIGLTSRGSGVDNVRNITATPTAGIDRDELIDTRPFAKALHYYILNNRDMYDLPRKFNVAFDGGGSITTVADTNDIGFVAVRVPEGKGVEPGIYFRVELAGITGHQQFAKDSGVLVTPGQCVAVAAAIIRVFVENGDRTNRKRARLKYVIDKWGIPKYIEEVEKKLAFSLLRLPLDQCEPRTAPIKHGHIGAFKQVQPGLNYVGAVITVGRMTPKQMRRDRRRGTELRLGGDSPDRLAESHHPQCAGPFRRDGEKESGQNGFPPLGDRDFRRAHRLHRKYRMPMGIHEHKEPCCSFGAAPGEETTSRSAD